MNEHAFDAAPTLELMYVFDSLKSSIAAAVAHLTMSILFSYLPFDVKIQRQAFAEMKTDKLTFDGFTRVPVHPLEDPQFAAFSTYE